MQKIKWTRSSTVSSNFSKSKKLSRVSIAALTLAVVTIGPSAEAISSQSGSGKTDSVIVLSQTTAASALAKLPVKGRAPKTGYTRDLFSDGWGDIGSCDTRNYILSRDLTKIVWRSGETCIVDSGVLRDPYTGATINFKRGVSSSLKVQIDHVVAVSDAWQKGAQKISGAQRYSFYNDPLNLLAVDGPTNSSKGDSDAASWLPPNKSFRCAYVARQVAVKRKYSLWVTAAEKDAISRVLGTCPKYLLPTK
ncbi:MAG: HNH endonuclease family protein [Microbacteriaceae bacterium]